MSSSVGSSGSSPSPVLRPPTNNDIVNQYKYLCVKHNGSCEFGQMKKIFSALMKFMIVLFSFPSVLSLDIYNTG